MWTPVCANPTQKLIPEKDKEQIKRLLLERIPLRGICRVMGVSLGWLLDFMASLYEELPDDLNFQAAEHTDELIIYTLQAEVDEMFSFVGSKKNKQWVWIAMDVKSRQIIAFHVGDRSRKNARELWKSIAQNYRLNATFYTDNWQAHKGVIPAKQHRVVKKQSRKNNHVERFNCTLRQRVSCLVRKALSFSKNLSNHIGAIKYFICHYSRQRALHV